MASTGSGCQRQTTSMTRDTSSVVISITETTTTPAAVTGIHLNAMEALVGLTKAFTADRGMLQDICPLYGSSNNIHAQGAIAGHAVNRKAGSWGMQRKTRRGALKALPMAVLSLNPARAARPRMQSAQFTAGT